MCETTSELSAGWLTLQPKPEELDSILIDSFGICATALAGHYAVLTEGTDRALASGLRLQDV